MWTNGPSFRRSRTSLALEDAGVATVVGFVLILAAALTYYSYAARSDVPKWGAESERAWDAAVGDALLRLERAAVAGVGSDASASASLPPAPTPRGLSLPFVAAARAEPPTGSLAFDPGCGGVWATHDVAGVPVPDLAEAGQGCLHFRAQATYSASYGYLLENGGLLRIQGDRAAVLAGPPLELKKEGGRYVASLTVLELHGPAVGVGADRAAVPIDLVPRPSSTESLGASNAASASWTFRSAWPDAWGTSLAGQVDAAGLDPALNWACLAGDARCPGLGADEVRVQLHGPTADPLVPDLSLSLSYGRYDVSVG